MESNWIIIARGGYLKAPVVEEITISDQDEDFDDEDFDGFEEYERYVLDESCAAYEQGFAQAIAFKKEELPDILEALQQIQ